MKNKESIQKISEFCKTNIDLIDSSLIEDYYYNSITLCVINAVFSINVKYKAVQNVIDRYCKYFEVKKIRDRWSDIPHKNDQESVDILLERYEKYGMEYFTNEIYKNRQLTSPRNGILKGEAVLQFCKVLKKHDVCYHQDIPRAMTIKELENEIRKIPGQKSGISLKYFWMLTGSDDLIKPDRMILRFLKRIINESITEEDAQSLLSETSDNLKRDYPQMTPRLLDYEIWKFESGSNL